MVSPVALFLVSYQSRSGDGIAFDVERFLVAFALARVEDKLRHAARVAHALRLEERHVVGHAVLRLAGGEACRNMVPRYSRPSRMAR